MCIPRSPRRAAWRSAAIVLAASMTISGVRAQPATGLTSTGLNYRIEGRGPTVVLIHAFHMDLREWDDVAAALVDSRRIVRYDVRGHGRSRVETPLPPSVADLKALFDELKIKSATLVGLSMGSSIALDFALTHPERAEGLMLFSPGLTSVKASAKLDWMRPVAAAIKNGRPQQAAELWWESPLLEGARKAGSRAERYRAVVLDNASIWTLPSPPPPLEPPASQRLKEIKVPVTAVAGALDASGSVEAAGVIANAVQNGRSIVIAGAWHMLSIEKPDEVARIILAR
jgi:pimeloyl-ACP methyl ester carboxylesterase